MVCWMLYLTIHNWGNPGEDVKGEAGKQKLTKRQWLQLKACSDQFILPQDTTWEAMNTLAVDWAATLLIKEMTHRQAVYELSSGFP